MTVRYATGEEARVGDRVEYLGEASVVSGLIADESRFQECGVDEPGVFLENISFGLVFEPVQEGGLGDWIVFRARAGS